MDQEPTDPKDLPTANTNSGAGHIDIDKVLLPQKEVRKVESAQRVNAGILLEQEQTAGREGTPKSPADSVSRSPSGPEDGTDGVHVQQNPPTTPKETSSVKSIETYQSDIEQLVQDKNVSVLTIAAAEAERRSKTAGAAETTEGSGKRLSFAQNTTEFIKKIAGRTAMILIGIILLVAAAGGVAYVVLRPTTAPPAKATLSPFIVVDDTNAVAISDTDSRGAVMQNLVSARDNTNLSLGLIDRLVPVMASTTPSGPTQTAMEVQSFLSLIAPNIPADLLRNIESTYLLGVHIYNSNQPFMILKIDSYEAAYAGMLAWEPDMLRDLSPLFAYTPRPRIPEENIGTSSASSTPDQFIQTGFVDRIVENHDARVLQNSSNDIYLLWTFLDRNTLVITTNEGTLREVISRLQNAPVTPIPGQ